MLYRDYAGLESLSGLGAGISARPRRVKVPCLMMRGGTSRAPFFQARDLPADPEARDRMLLRMMGCPEFNRIDGIAGMSPVTSKLAIVSPSQRTDADVDYLFGQADLAANRLDYAANCGNILSAVGPFAIETGLVPAQETETLVRIHNVNTGVIVHARVQTPGREVQYEGDFEIDGAPGTGAPIGLEFLDTVGAITGKLFPTGRIREKIQGIEASCLDVAVPLVILRASDLGYTGRESAEMLNQDRALLGRIEEIRLEAGHRMGLGDCRGSVLPKVCLIARPSGRGDLLSRYFTPFECHPSHAVTGALCLGVASLLPGTVAQELSGRSASGLVRIEHPSGTIEADLRLDKGASGDYQVSRAAFVRTASKIFEGSVFVSL